MNKGILYLIPSPLAGDALFQTPSSTIKLVDSINEWIVENERSARRSLRLFGRTGDLKELTFHTLNEHTPINEIEPMLSAAENGKPVGLMSEAGCPAIADPGAEIVLAAHRKGIRVVPFPGPSSILLALMASGMNGQNFQFHGYLSRDVNLVKRQITDIENHSRSRRQTQIFIETPYRNGKLLNTLLETCKSNTLLCIAVNITSLQENINTKSIAEWKMAGLPDVHKKPAVFLLNGY